MKQKTILSWIMAFCGIIPGAAMATTFSNTTTPFSKYGLIQNVQNYSTNPFWSPDAPYNQRLPVPVYVQGIDVDTTDCQTVVAALIASYCASRDNCVGMDVNDARPTITVQLASLPNHNYVTPCAGYIDTEFEKYVSQHSYVTPGANPTPFPSATGPNYYDYNATNAAGNATATMPTQQATTTSGPNAWMREMEQRKQELQNLQSANQNTTTLARADFPTTANDLTFTQQIQNQAAGYAPYKDASAYDQLNLKSVTAQHDQRVNAYCEKQSPRYMAVLNDDLATMRKCQTRNTPFTACVAHLQGLY